MVEDILGVTPPEMVPGNLFNAMVDKLHEFYPVSKKKAARAVVALLMLQVSYYEVAVEAEDGEV